MTPRVAILPARNDRVSDAGGQWQQCSARSSGSASVSRLCAARSRLISFVRWAPRRRSYVVKSCAGRTALEPPSFWHAEGRGVESHHPLLSVKAPLEQGFRRFGLSSVATHSALVRPLS